MALFFNFLGCTNHEMVYEVNGGERGSGGFGTASLTSLGGATPSPDMVTDAKPRTPLGDFVAQHIVANLAAEYVFLQGLSGEHSIAPRLIGEAYIVPFEGNLNWDLVADDDGNGNLILTVTNSGSVGEISNLGSALLRIRTKHTFDR